MVLSEVQKAWEACDRIDTVFVLVCTVFCWPIIPAVGLGYSGYSTRRSGLASFIPAVLTVCVCSIQWFIIGYTLAYGDGPGGVIGNLQHAFHRGVLAEPVGSIPAVLFSEFQLVFEATVCAIAVGGACERGRILPLIPFIFVCISEIAHRADMIADTLITAMVDIHLLPFGAYGLGRWLPG
jgi:ammonia channel protein AmtB